MEIPHILDETSTAWEWSNLLDFTVDDGLNLSWSLEDLTVDEVSIPSSEVVGEPSNQGSDSSEKIRKRDPRLTCENFLAGRIPCSCPEVDEKDEEEGEVGKKRARTVKAGVARCQVPGCEADISELKGYHKRHRVCLRCANANTVVLDGQPKRYCQQCGKFHILPDFDEGKRSCRRKLEHHNRRRRRRKSTNFENVVEKEAQRNHSAEDVACDGEAGKDNLCSSNHVVDGAVLASEDGHTSPLCSLPSSQNIQGDGVMSFVSSGETQREGGKDNSKCTISSSFWDNKNAYSSACPTGRISFKLYDWNPAEFPRRLRHQIFQWLSSMPVELEGYIRPGCTILTVFITMPQFMWEKLSEDSASYIHGIVNAPESVLFGRGSMLVYINDMIFRVLKGGTSIIKIKVEMQAPKLHYVYPTCFEAGKPMEFVACGSNLLQPKFRFLVSFAGRYLAYDCCLAIPHGTGSCQGNEEDTVHSCGHQKYKIHIPNTEPKLFGPAFIEVENESGLSNFIPVLFGDRKICSEMEMMQQRFDKCLCSRGSQFADLDSMSEPCEAFELRQTAMSELLLDIAWLLKKPKLEDRQYLLSSTQIQKYNCLLNFLIQNGSTVVLVNVLQSLKSVMNAENLHNPFSETSDADMELFQNYIDHAREIVHQRLQHAGGLKMHSEYKVPNWDCISQNKENDMLNVMPSQDLEMAEELGSMITPTFQYSSGTAPLINKEVVMNVNHRPHLMKVWPEKSCGRILSRTLMGPRPLLLMVAAAAVCFGACTVLLHPNKVGEFAVSIRRCLFGNSNP